MANNKRIVPRNGLASGHRVFAPDLVDAEVYAKCVLILGADNGMRWLADRHPACAAAAVHADGSLMMSRNLNQYIMKEP